MKFEVSEKNATIWILTIAVDIAWLSGVCESCALVGVEAWVSIQTLGHFVTNHINKSFEHPLKKKDLYKEVSFMIFDVICVANIKYL